MFVSFVVVISQLRLLTYRAIECLGILQGSVYVNEYAKVFLTGL